MDLVGDNLNKLSTHKFIGPNRMHSRVLREMAELIAKSLSVVSERSWRMGEVLVDCWKASVSSVFKKDKKEEPGNYKPISLTAVPGKVME